MRTTERNEHQINAEQKNSVIQRSRQDPLFFPVQVLGTRGLWSKQREIIRSVHEHQRTTVRSCHGAGKTFTAGQVALSRLFPYAPSIVLTTAPTWRQVEKGIWKEIRAAYRRSRYPLGGTLMPKSPELQILQDEWYAAGFSSNDPDKIQGTHEDYLTVIADEAAGIIEDMFPSIDGLLTTDNSRLLLIANPTTTSGTFYRSFREPGWNKIKITAFDTPNFTAFGITEEDIAGDTWRDRITGPYPYPKLVTPQWVADKYQRWGPKGPLYQSRVLAEFPDFGEGVIIPLAWIDAAMARNDPPGLPFEFGFDIALGGDRAILAIRKGNVITELREYHTQDIMELTGHAARVFREEGATKGKIDVIGIGAGVYGRLKEQGFPVVAVNVGAAPTIEPDPGDPEFVNLKAQVWWSMRERLDPNPAINPHPVSLINDEELLEELAVHKTKDHSAGKIQVMPKEWVRKLLGRSPDKADAVILAFAEVQGIPEPQIW